MREAAYNPELPADGIDIGDDSVHDGGRPAIMPREHEREGRLGNVVRGVVGSAEQTRGP